MHWVFFAALTVVAVLAVLAGGLAEDIRNHGLQETMIAAGLGYTVVLGVAALLVVGVFMPLKRALTWLGLTRFFVADVICLAALMLAMMVAFGAIGM